MEIRELSTDEWGDALPSTGVEPFHHPAALAVLDDHAAGRLRLFGGFKGEHAVALLPVFEQRRRPGRVLVSPPPTTGVARLGPVLCPNSPKRRARELVNRRFVDGVLDELDTDSSLTLFRAVCSTAYDDPRPFAWRDYGVDTRFTYVLDLDDVSPDEALAPFSSSLRKEMRRRDDLDVSIAVEGLDAARQVCEDVVERFDEQGERSPVRWPLVRDLVEALDDGCRVYVARDADGTYLSGLVVLYAGDTAYYWQGGASATYEGVSVNSLIHRTVIEDVITDAALSAVDRYDLMGANTERLCRYKSKFGADLVPYYGLESNGAGMVAAKTAYRLVGK